VQALQSGKINADDDLIFKSLREWATTNATPECTFESLLHELLPPRVLFNARIRQRILYGRGHTGGIPALLNAW
jgi:hypothetical protein